MKYRILIFSLLITALHSLNAMNNNNNNHSGDEGDPNAKALISLTEIAFLGDQKIDEESVELATLFKTLNMHKAVSPFKLKGVAKRTKRKQLDSKSARKLDFSNFPSQ